MRFYKQFLLFIFIAAAFAACSSAPKKTLTPLETLKEYGDAFQKKDITTMKLLLSQESLKMHEQEAKAQNTTVDELLKKDNGSPIKEMPETRNEKIEGETATVEVKNIVTNEFDTIPFVKEEGNWKIALDKFMQDIQKKALEQMKMPSAEDDAGAAKPKGDAKPKTDK
jgi:hypothetical protein